MPALSHSHTDSVHRAKLMVPAHSLVLPSLQPHASSLSQGRNGSSNISGSPGEEKLFDDSTDSDSLLTDSDSDSDSNSGSNSNSHSDDDEDEEDVDVVPRAIASSLRRAPTRRVPRRQVSATTATTATTATADTADTAVAGEAGSGIHRVEQRMEHKHKHEHDTMTDDCGNISHTSHGSLKAHPAVPARTGLNEQAAALSENNSNSNSNSENNSNKESGREREREQGSETLPPLLRFSATMIEQIRVFDSSEPPAKVALAATRGVADNFDVDCASVSLARALAAAWTVRASNLPRAAAFGTRPVVLEAVRLVAPAQLAGAVLVRNIVFAKQVFLRCTLDGWRSHRDLPCSFDSVIAPSANGFVGVERFIFNIDLSLPSFAEPLKAAANAQSQSQSQSLSNTPSPSLKASSSLAGLAGLAVAPFEFAVCFRAESIDHWDNNSGDNFVLWLAPPGSSPSSSVEPPPLLRRARSRSTPPRHQPSLLPFAATPPSSASVSTTPVLSIPLYTPNHNTNPHSHPHPPQTQTQPSGATSSPLPIPVRIQSAASTVTSTPSATIPIASSSPSIMATSPSGTKHHMHHLHQFHIQQQAASRLSTSPKSISSMFPISSTAFSPPMSSLSGISTHAMSRHPSV